MRHAVLALVALSAGCVFDPIDLTGFSCPCPDGYTCVADECVLDEEVDAGAPDARDAGGASDAGMDAAVPDAGPGSCPDDAFCESFETSNPGANGWRRFPDPSRVTYVNATRPDPRITAFRGSGMVRVTTVTPGGAAEIEICPFEGFTCPPTTEMFDADVVPDGGVADLPGITSGDIYMRAHIYIPSTLEDGTELVMGHASVMHVGMHRGTYVRETVVGFNNDVDHVAMYVGTGPGRVEPRPPSGTPDDRPVFPRDEWVCIRTHIAVDPAAGSVATYVGNSTTAAVERTGIDTLATFPFRHFGVGLGYTDNMDNGAVIYLDEVAIGRSPIPCVD